MLSGKINNAAARLVARDRGTNRPGSRAMKIDPGFIRHLSGIDPEKVMFVTGTNGKSTTNNMINHILRSMGYHVVSNIEGANLITGVATALVRDASLNGNVEADYYVFETDERYLARIARQLPAAYLLVTNLMKDQVQRNGDPDFIYRKIRNVADEHGYTLILNADEPRSASLALTTGLDESGKSGTKAVYYGARKHGHAFVKSDGFATMPCPICHHKIVFDYHNNDGMGSYRCDNCGYSNHEADYLLTDIDLDAGTAMIDGHEFALPYDQPYMLYDFASAIAACNTLAGVSVEDCVRALESFVNVGGRVDSLDYRDKHIKYMRFKQENPETLTNFINIIASDPEEKVVVIGFGTINDFDPHYINSFYAFDCDLSALERSNVSKYIFVTDTVCYDAANSFIYGGVDPDKIEVIPTNDEKEILDAIADSGCSNVYLTIELHRFERMKAFSKKGVRNGR